MPSICSDKPNGPINHVLWCLIWLKSLWLLCWLTAGTCVFIPVIKRTDWYIWSIMVGGISAATQMETLYLIWLHNQLQFTARSPRPVSIIPHRIMVACVCFSQTFCLIAIHYRCRNLFNQRQPNSPNRAARDGMYLKHVQDSVVNKMYFLHGPLL